MPEESVKVAVRVRPFISFSLHTNTLPDSHAGIHVAKF